MEIFRKVADMQAASLQLKREGRRIGFVPTMGCLHEGHLSLVRRAAELADVVVVSIFVNPTQFGPGEDFGRYPRDEDRDLALCRDEGVAVAFCPSPGEMYPPDASVHVAETLLSRGLCGRSRPAHFRGVATVVAKLFNTVLPDVAVFGQKDAQQARVIQRMVRDLNFPVAVEIAPIVREQDGLAMSSRNCYLATEQRARALCLRRALDLAERLVSEGETDAVVIRERMVALIEDGDPPVEIDYVEVVDWRLLEPVARVESETLVAVAVKVGVTRLIDNAIVSPG